MSTSLEQSDLDQLRQSKTNRIAELRKKNHLTLLMLSSDTGIHFNTLSQYENGKRYPTRQNFLKLANYFHVTPRYLAGYNSDQEMESSKLLRDTINEANNANEKALNLLIEHIEKLNKEIDTLGQELSIANGRIKELENVSCDYRKESEYRHSLDCVFKQVYMDSNYHKKHPESFEKLPEPFLNIALDPKN